MRKLTVIRRKSFVGCLASVKLYIEDPNGSTEINGVKCRFLGKLKNNRRVTFEIGEDSFKLFAIYGKMSKGYCNDFYRIPAGREDHFVSGIANFSPIEGNPFCFDGVSNDQEVIANRQKNINKGTVIFVVSLVIGLALGVGIVLCNLFL